MAPDRKTRTLIAHNTIQRSPAIVAEHTDQGATAHPTFVAEQLSALNQALCPNPDSDPTPVETVNADSLATARVSVLNLASDILPAGPLCYSSTLYITLKKSYYPWPNLGEGCVAGVYSPGVVLPKAERCVVSIITVAASRHPELTPNKRASKFPATLADLRGKIRLVYRMAAYNGQQYLVVGAMGCGAYACPPQLVATEMRDILLEPEFRGSFRKVVFAIYSAPSNGAGTFEIFRKFLTE
ncbi:hypothetical protein B0H10DRAFT_2164385 [Mycena sp. CBHHK59/15]|nr:hypothetical protein B0H10DRAFT_2164385 [Mycena sp. CBHHK59/15]